MILGIYESGISENLKISKFPEVLRTELQDFFVVNLRFVLFVFDFLILEYDNMMK